MKTVPRQKLQCTISMSMYWLHLNYSPMIYLSQYDNRFHRYEKRTIRVRIQSRLDRSDTKHESESSKRKYSWIALESNIECRKERWPLRFHWKETDDPSSGAMIQTRILTFLSATLHDVKLRSRLKEQRLTHKSKVRHQDTVRTHWRSYEWENENK